MNNGLILTELITKHICHVTMYVFATVSTSLVKQYSQLGLRRPEPIYICVLVDLDYVFESSLLWVHCTVLETLYFLPSNFNCSCWLSLFNLKEVFLKDLKNVLD